LAVRSALRAAADDKPARDGVRGALEQHNHADGGIVEVVDFDRADPRKR
jgi:hypothetical protein